MIKFLKENIIFVTSSILLMGLVIIIPQLNQISVRDKETIDQPSSTGDTYPAELKVSPSANPSSIENKTLLPTPTISIPKRPHINEEDDD